jgi:hypothetical protein
VLISIKVDPNNIILNEDGRIILKVEHFGPFANPVHLITIKGETVDDFYGEKALKSKTVLVGVKGGLSLE